MSTVYEHRVSSYPAASDTKGLVAFCQWLDKESEDGWELLNLEITAQGSQLAGMPPPRPVFFMILRRPRRVEAPPEEPAALPGSARPPVGATELKA